MNLCIPLALVSSLLYIDLPFGGMNLLDCHGSPRIPLIILAGVSFSHWYSVGTPCSDHRDLERSYFPLHCLCLFRISGPGTSSYNHAWGIESDTDIQDQVKHHLLQEDAWTFFSFRPYSSQDTSHLSPCLWLPSYIFVHISYPLFESRTYVYLKAMFPGSEQST